MSVLVFKEQSENYKTALERINYRPIFIPVLKSIHVDTPTLSDLISKGAEDFDGVVVTSQRAVEAWKEAASSAEVRISQDSRKQWSDSPFYSVGPSTSSALRSLAHSTKACFAPRHILGGEESGNGVKLADYIVSSNKNPNRILYLVGDKTASDLSNILQQNGVEVTRMQVYATQALTTEEIQARIQNTDAADSKWIVVFSPSGANVIIPAIKNLGLDMKVASIGPTTSRHLHEKMDTLVDAVPTKPDAELLAEEMFRSDMIQDGK